MRRCLLLLLAAVLLPALPAHAALHHGWKEGRQLKISEAVLLAGDVPKLAQVRMWADPPPPPPPAPVSSVFPVARPSASPLPVPTTVVFSGRVPSWFWDQAMCIHSHEGSWTDTSPPVMGGLQFMQGTWEGAGGSGNPGQASIGEQVYRAWIVVQRDGGWSEWTTAGLCGLG